MEITVDDSLTASAIIAIVTTCVKEWQLTLKWDNIIDSTESISNGLRPDKLH